MSDSLRVGVIGTLVCDVIHGPPPDHTISEGWGGIAYALSGLGPALAENWHVIPIMKVGADVIDEARPWVAATTRIAPDATLIVVPEPNNRSELRYLTAEHRTERMSGGVPGWSTASVLHAVQQARLDALYINFLSGIEIDLPTMQALREHFPGPIYVDLHMMLWHTDATGGRSLQPLDNAAAWCACFDFIQVNEDEMRMLADHPDAFAALAIGAGALATFVTLGARGVQFHSHPAFQSLADRQAIRRETAPTPDTFVSGIQSPYPVQNPERIDPTGCGDVFGGTCFARLLAGETLAQALQRANRAASLNAESQGVEGLAARLAARHAMLDAAAFATSMHHQS